MDQEQEEPLVKDSVPAKNGHQVPMEIDTGSAKTVIGEKVFNKIQTGDTEISLVPSETVLSTYSGETISPISMETRNLISLWRPPSVRLTHSLEEIGCQ